MATRKDELKELDKQIAEHEQSATAHAEAAQTAEALRYKKFKLQYSDLEVESAKINATEEEAHKVGAYGIFEATLSVQAPDSEKRTNLQINATGVEGTTEQFRKQLIAGFFSLARQHNQHLRQALQNESPHFWQMYLADPEKWQQA